MFEFFIRFQRFIVWSFRWKTFELWKWKIIIQPKSVKFKRMTSNTLDLGDVFLSPSLPISKWSVFFVVAFVRNDIKFIVSIKQVGNMICKKSSAISMLKSCDVKKCRSVSLRENNSKTSEKENDVIFHNNRHSRLGDGARRCCLYLFKSRVYRMCVNLSRMNFIPIDNLSWSVGKWKITSAAAPK